MPVIPILGALVVYQFAVGRIDRALTGSTPSLVNMALAAGMGVGGYYVATKVLK